MPVPQLVLAAPDPDLVEQVLVWRSQPDVTRWLLRTPEDSDAFTTAWLNTQNDPLDHSFVAVLDGRAVAIGSLEVSNAAAQDHAVDPPSVDAEGMLGYLVDPAYAGRGIGTAVATALLRIAFEEVGLHRVTAGCFADNVASWRVMEKAGMRREGHSVRDAWHAELGWVDGYQYAILADEWRPA